LQGREAGVRQAEGDIWFWCRETVWILGGDIAESGGGHAKYWGVWEERGGWLSLGCG